jgi:hypothetical protein
MMIVENRPVLPKVSCPFTEAPQLSLFSLFWYSSKTEVMTQGPTMASFKLFC